MKTAFNGTFHYIVDTNNQNLILALYGEALFDNAEMKLSELKKRSFGTNSILKIITHKGVKRSIGNYLKI